MSLTAHDSTIIAGFDAAIREAERFIGATSPNPPVGAAALDGAGRILMVRAHEKAGDPHAEALVLAECQEEGLLERVDTLVVTLEPCNHQGRTPACSRAIASLGAEDGRPLVRRVIYAVRDPNPRVPGGGAEFLSSCGVEVLALKDLNHPGARDLVSRCEELIRPFRHWATTGRPWVTVKTAHQASTLDPKELGPAMIPPPGQKTFTSPRSLKLAHELRKRADAILTGSGTVLADQPEFTVRHVKDHPGKVRWLVVMDRRKRVPESWLKEAENRGFKAVRGTDLETVLCDLGKAGVLEVLVEAGPELSSGILQGDRCLWDQHVVITRGDPDIVESRFREPSV